MANVEDKDQIKEFGSLLEELRKQLLNASIYFDIWEQLWPTQKVVNVINRYKGFFHPIRNVLFDQFSIKICSVVSNDGRSPSFYKVLKLLDINPNLTPEIKARSLRKRLKQHRAVLNAIDNYRNTKAAHTDIHLTVEKKPVLYGDSKKMLIELQGIFNEISRAFDQKVWSFKPIEHGDTTTLLNHLNELSIIHKKRIKDLYTMNKS
jgi:hypothetical protein